MADIPIPQSNYAGDVDIDLCVLSSSNGFQLDISPQVINIEIYEDLFAPFITGRIILKDAIDLPTLFPLVGEEVLQLTISNPLLVELTAHAGTYYVFKLDDRVKSAEREQVYVLHFMSMGALADVNKKISRTYSGKVSDIVQKLFLDADALETGKRYTIEETPVSTKYTSNFWSPLQNLNYLADQAVNNNQVPSFVFFENRNGMNFVSLESLYTPQEPYQIFKWDNYSADFNSKSDLSGSEKNVNRDYQKIIQFSTPETFNYVERLMSGMYGSQMIHYDLTTKKYSHTSFTPDFNQDKHLNDYPLRSNKLITKTRSLLIREHKHYNNFENYGDVTNTKTLQRRLYLMTLAEANKLEIVVFGRTDYTVGQKVYVEIPVNRNIAKHETDYIDKILSGYYIIAALCHKVDRQKHECVMELVKDSLLLDLNNVKHEAQ